MEENFLDDLCKVQDIIAELWDQHGQTSMIPLTPAENTQFSEAQNCYICSKPFKYDGTLDMWMKQREELKEMNKMESSRKRKMSSEDSPKFKNHFKCSVDELGPRVRDHDHFRGNYRGPAHAKCNLLMGLNKNRTPFYFHNGGKYDCKVLSQVKNNFYFFKFFFLVYH